MTLKKLYLFIPMLSLPFIAQAQCEKCPEQVGEKVDFCFSHELFPGKCAQFTDGQAFFYFFPGKKYVQIPLVEKADLEYFHKLASSKEYKKFKPLDLLFLQEAIAAWETARLDIGYTFTDSGLGVKIMKEGTGELTKKGQKIKVHYTGYLKDGSKFDSSVDRGNPFIFPLGAGRVIKGWDEGMADLKVGTKAMLKIPPELGYGNRPTGSIPPNSTLYFEVEVLGIEE